MVQSVLVVDDDENSLMLYQKLLSEKLSLQIQTAKHPTHAYKLATEGFYDICLIDITMDFHGSPFGGIELYNMLINRYGGNSLIAYSQYITDDLLRRYQCSFNFLEKKPNVLQCVEDMVAAIREHRTKQTCFVAMPFAEKYLPLYQVIENVIKTSGYVPVRIDKETFTDSIVARMFAEINNCKVVIFVATDKNPNAFYECGYAIALKKEVITIADSFENLPFDIRDRNSIAYGGDIIKIEGSLSERLAGLTRVR